MKVKRLDKSSMDLIEKIDSKMDPIQSELDALNSQFKSAMSEVLKIKDKIKPVKAQISPLGQIKASIASADSRDKYFPDMSKNEFLEFVKSKI